MKRLFIIILSMMAMASLWANDGAFYAEGNQLIPITETTIRVQKEILTITRVRDTINDWGSLFQVNVYYEFFNPGPAKDLIVGFESPTPSGNAYDGSLDEAYAGHPYMYDFKVVMNRKTLPFQVAHVPYKFEGDYQFDYSIDPRDYYRNGRVQDMSQAQYLANLKRYFPDYEDGDDIYLDFYGYLFYYVYHFNAHFNEGLNVIQHTYTVKGSSLVMTEYVFNYILTAANRWANNGIDDFTLEINMGDHASFSVAPSFFDKANDWTFSGKGKAGQRQNIEFESENCPIFHVQSGSIVYHKKNFHPEGELYIMSDSPDMYSYDRDQGRYKVSQVPYLLENMKSQYTTLYIQKDFETGELPYTDATDEQKRLMKNMPFAYRGYVFKSRELQQYFESTEWYIPNPDYKADMTKLNKDEKEWVQFWSK